MYSHGDVEALAVFRFRHVERRVAEIRIGKSVTEGISHICRIIVFARIARAVDVIRVTGFVIAIADIDTFTVNAVIFLRFVRQIAAILIGRHEQLHIIITLLHHRGGRKVIIQIGIRQFSRWNNLSCQGLRNCRNSVFTHVSDPKARIHVYCLSFEKVQLNRRGRIERNDNLFYRPFFFQLRKFFQDVYFCLRQ